MFHFRSYYARRDTVISLQLHALKFAKLPRQSFAPQLPNPWETPHCAGESNAWTEFLRLPNRNWTKYVKPYCCDMRLVKIRSQAAPQELVPAWSIRRTKLISNHLDPLVVYVASVIPSRTTINLLLKYNTVSLLVAFDSIAHLTIRSC